MPANEPQTETWFGVFSWAEGDFEMVDFYRSDKEVSAMLGIGRSTLWAWVAQGRFPAPLKIGPRTSRWSDRVIQQWQDSLDLTS